MRSFLLYTLSHISRKKGQTLLLGLSIAITTLLFTTSAGLLSSINSPIEAMFKEQRGAHILFEIDTTIYETKTIDNWWKTQPEVTDTEIYTRLYRETGFITIWKGDHNTERQVDLYERPADASMDILKFIEGEKKPAPGIGEIWLPSVMKQSLNIEVGEKIHLPLESGREEFTVTAYVVDPQFNSAFINPKRVWVAPGTLPLYTSPGELKKLRYAVHFKDAQKFNTMWDRFEEFMGGSFGSEPMLHSAVVKIYTFAYHLIAYFMLFFSLIGIVLSSFIVHSTISGTIYSSYRQIGILKSLGYTPGNIRFSFVLKYLIISLFAIPVSLISSTYIIPSLLNLFTRASGIPTGENTWSGVIIITALLYLFFILISVLILSGKAGKIIPVEAIRMGESAGQKKRVLKRITGQLIRTTPVTAGLSTLFLTDKKGRIGVNLFLMILFSFAIYCSLSTALSVSRFSGNLVQWGLHNAHVKVDSNKMKTLKDYENLKKELWEDPDTLAVLPFGYFTDGSILGDKTEGYCVGEIYDGDLNLADLTNLEGRHPIAAGEISLASNTAEINGFQAGDQLTLMIYGKPWYFTVTGIYQSINNMGIGYRIRKEAIQEALPLFKPDTFLIKLKDPAAIKKWIEKTEALYGENIDAMDHVESTARDIKPFALTITLFCGVMILMFFIIAFALILNTTVMEINDRNRTLGILKVLGLNTIQIRKIFILKSLTITLTGTTLGIILSLMTIKPLMNSVMGPLMGLKQAPVEFTPALPLFTALFLLFTGTVSTWFPSSHASKADPRNLITE